LGIENRKPKFFFSLFKPATTTQKNYFILNFLFFIFFERPRLHGMSASAGTCHVRTDTRLHPRGRLNASTRTDFTASADGKNPSAGKTASAG
jgi:hypothetical protein